MLLANVHRDGAIFFTIVNLERFFFGSGICLASAAPALIPLLVPVPPLHSTVLLRQPHHLRRLIAGKRRRRSRAQVETAARLAVNVHAHVGDRRVVALRRRRLRGRIAARLELRTQARRKCLRPDDRFGKVLPRALMAAGDCNEELTFF